MIIKAEAIQSIKDDREAAKLVLCELLSYRTAEKLKGLAVIHEQREIEFFKRKCHALFDAVLDLVRVVKTYGGELRIFTNFNREAAIKNQDDSDSAGITLSTNSNNRKGLELLKKAQAMRKRAYLNRAHGSTRKIKIERLMIGRADALESKAIMLCSN